MNPKIGLPVLAGASISTAVVLWVLEPSYPGRDLGFFRNMAVAAFTAFLGAGVGLWVYGWLSEEGRKRQNRHEVEVRHFEEIYGPLFEEMRKVVEELARYGYPYLHKWREIRESRFGEFVEDGIRSGLESLSSEFENLIPLSRAASAEASARVLQALASLPMTKGLNESQRSGVVSQLENDVAFRFDPATRNVPDHDLEGLEKALKAAGARVTPDRLNGLVEHVKTYILGSDAVRERASKVEELLPRAVELRNRIRRRMLEPFR